MAEQRVEAAIVGVGAAMDPSLDLSDAGKALAAAGNSEAIPPGPTASDMAAMLGRLKLTAKEAKVFVLDDLS
jgi:hypothetical protein